MIKYFVAPLLLILFFHFSAVSQQGQYDSLMKKVEDFGFNLLYRNHDTAYIKSYAEHLNIKVLAINKYNFFQAIDRDNEASVRYRPDRQINLGIGIAYKWFAIDVAFNVGLKENAVPGSEFFDFQGTVFSSKQFISASLQYYYGYQLADFSGFPGDPGQNIPREDIRTSLLTLQYLFAYNYDKFSLKAPFILNEVQKKNAGSLLFGASFKMFTMNADSSLAPTQSAALSEFPIIDVHNIRLGIKVGYMYTFTFLDGYFITISAIPELGYNKGDFSTGYRTAFSNHFSLGYTTMNAFGYNGKRFYSGVQIISDGFAIRLDDDYRIQVGNGKMKFFVGYRFLGKRKKTD